MHSLTASLLRFADLVQVGRQQTSAEVGLRVGARERSALLRGYRTTSRAIGGKGVEVLALGCALAGRVGKPATHLLLVLAEGWERDPLPRSQCDPWGRSMTVERALSGSRTLSGGPDRIMTCHRPVPSFADGAQGWHVM